MTGVQGLEGDGIDMLRAQFLVQPQEEDPHSLL